MTTDPIADFLIRLKNANLAKKIEVTMPFSKIKQELADLLVKEGYVIETARRGKRTIKDLVVTLKYTDEKPAITGTKRVSKPGRRLYRGVREIHPVKRGRGLLVLSTPKGILTDRQARTERVGGEALFEIW
jgi:small subunit ribosomal protein S8